MGRALLLLLLVITLFVKPTEAGADEPPLPVRRIGLQKTDDSLYVTFSYRDAFTKEVHKKLSSGLTTSVVVQLTVERKGVKRPLMFWARTVEVTYDLWEEQFLVVREDDTGRKRAKVVSRREAIDLSGILKRTAIGRIPEMPPGLYRVHARIETNPVSREMVEKIRTWLASTRAKKRGNIATSNYFGSFVGALVDRQISQAEHVIEFVSQWFRLRGR